MEDILLLLLLLSHLSRVRLCETPQTEAHQAALSLTFSRQEHWTGLPFPSPRHEGKSESEVAQSCLTLCDPTDCSLPGSSIHGFSRQEYWSGHLQSFPAARSFPVSQLFSSGDQSIRASALASLSNEYSGLISSRIDWFVHLAVQGTLKSLLQHYNSKASVLQLSVFFRVQLSYPLLKKPPQL